MKCLALVLGLSALAAAAPQVPVSPSPADVEEIVTRFFVTARHYQRTFRNLVADETRLNEELSRSGGIRRRRELVSDLLVYRPMRATDEEEGIEYRDVRVVDGKPIDKRGKRALDVITRATSAKSLEEELRLINQESIRYDFDRHVGGFTISQLSRRTMREDSRFSWAGRSQVDGHDVVSLEYRQVVPREIDPGISDLYRRMGVTSFFERGRVWLDATTFQVRRSRWEAGRHASLVAATNSAGRVRFHLRRESLRHPGASAHRVRVVRGGQDLDGPPGVHPGRTHDVHLWCVQALRRGDPRDGLNAVTLTSFLPLRVVHRSVRY